MRQAVRMCVMMGMGILAAAAGCARPSGGSPDAADGAVADLVPPDFQPPPDLVVPPDLTPPGDLTVPADLVPSGRPPGDTCVVDTDCQSRLCRPVVPGAQAVCVAPCTSQADCAAYLNQFCEPQTPGAQDGLCIPRSPAHCASCAQDNDCGSLAERCIAGPGDPAPACHIDCALAGDAACPPDYACTQVQDGATPRQLCVPKPVASVPVACLDAVGGYCDRVATPLACLRQNQAGTCTGQRTCQVNTKRFDRCNALSPQYKQNCSDQDPAGCILQYASGIATTKDNCGTCGNACGATQDCCNLTCTLLGTIQNCAACGNACPGQTNTSTATCSGTCGLTCNSENYDVDGTTGNGCERADSPLDNHTAATATFLGTVSCFNTPPPIAFIGILPSDARMHSPIINGFNANNGDAPDWFRIRASGGACVNDIDLLFQITSAANLPTCYRMFVYTDNGTYQCAANSSGTCSVTRGGISSYSDNTDIYIQIEKTCSSAMPDYATYSVNGHL